MKSAIMYLKVNTVSNREIGLVNKIHSIRHLCILLKILVNNERVGVKWPNLRYVKTIQVENLRVRLKCADIGM